MSFENALGLLAGIQFVRFGPVKLEEYYLQDGCLRKGPRLGANIVVKLSPGWTTVYDINNDSLIPTQAFDPPQEHTFKIRANNSLELDDILGLKKRLSEKGLLVEDQAPETESETELNPTADADRGHAAADGSTDPGSGVPSTSPPGH